MWPTINMVLGKTLFGVLIILFCATSCSGTEYTTQHFSFPPGSKPHESEWQYMTLVTVSSSVAPITDKTKKIVRIKIYDKSNTVFLDEEYEFTCASVRASVAWSEFENIKVDLDEVGNKFAKDSYNDHLLKAGPNRLIELTYRFDQTSNKFQRTNRQTKRPY